MKYTFTTEERAEINSAIRSLESATGGELVPYFVRSSGDYAEASWKMAALAGLVSTIIMAYGPVSAEIEIVVVVLIMAVAFILPMFIPAMKRLAVAEDKMKGVVLGRAKDAFFDEGVSNTKDRIGILLFISRIERQVVVLGDSAITARVDYKDWYRVGELVVDGIRKKEIGAGIAKAIEHCERLLVEHGFEGNGDPQGNELADGLRG